MKLENYRIFLLAVGLFVFAGFIGAAPVHALSISPVTFELFADPGETINSQMRVSNNTGDPVSVGMGVETFVPVGEEGKVVLDSSEEQTSFSPAHWVVFDNTSFTLQPGEVQVINFSVSIPANAEPGGHYASILARTSADLQGGGVGVAQKIGALLLIQVSGDVKEELVLKTFTAPNFSEYGPVTLTARFENLGSVHLKPRGSVTLKNIFGKEIAESEADIVQQNVLPNSIRKIEIPVGEKNMFGRYTADLLTIYGSANEPMSAQVAFWVIPWKTALIVLLAVLILAILMYRGRVRLRKAFGILLRGK